ncbi:hypothetical protein AAMO2058_001148400 [Amorphochlora amoebiformis]|uniref:Hexose transporter 1 n=1 Tax=Amorphochlora amoebiformis TaxID=1561963 RepID=A0A6T6UTC4_9EUKA
MADASEPLLPGEKKAKSINATGAIFAASIATIGSFMFGFNIGFTSPSLPSLEWGTDPVFGDCSEWIQDSNGGYSCKESAQGAFFSAIINFGAMAGAFAGGPIVDSIGRKYSVILSAVPLILGWLWIAIGAGYFGMLAARVATGFGMGLVTISVNVYVTEISPSHLRGALSSMFQLNLTIGILAVYLIGEYLTTSQFVTATMNPTNPPAFKYGQHLECNWRLLSYVGAGISTLMFVGMLFMPESPRYLLLNNRQEEAIKALNFFKGATYNAYAEVESFRKQEEDEYVEEAGEESCASTWLTRGSLIPMGIMLVLHTVQQFSGINAVIFFCQTIFADAGVSNPVVASVTVAIVQVVFTGLLTMGLLDLAGRRVMLTLSLIGMTISCIGMSTAFHLKEVDNAQDWLAFASLLGYIASFSIGTGAIVWVIMGEILPLKIRGLGSSIASGFNWTCSFVVTFMFSIMLTKLKGVGTFLFYAAVCAFGAVFTYVVVPETKGLELEAIEKLFLTRMELIWI